METGYFGLEDLTLGYSAGTDGIGSWPYSASWPKYFGRGGQEGMQNVERAAEGLEIDMHETPGPSKGVGKPKIST